MIAIRVDGNDKIGTGHVMRCLAIAESFREEGVAILFITADEKCRIFIKNRGFQSVCLDSNWDNLNTEISKLVCVINEYSIEKLIIDTYQITDLYFKKLKPYCKLYYIDDYGDKCYTLNGVINYNITAELSQYKKIYDGTDTKLIIGTKYVPLRREFQSIKPIKIKKRIKNVLITTGGTDPYEISTQLAGMIIETEEFSEINFHFVCGRFYKNSELLKKICKKYHNILVHTNVQKMSELMLVSDLAISAGGSTLYELCACGVPTICFSIAENQDEAINTFAQKGCMLKCDYKNKMFYKDIKKKIKYFAQNDYRRYELHKIMSKVIDSNGVSNMVDMIIEG